MAEPTDLAAELTELAAAHGLDAVGFAGADPFEDTRRHLEARRAAGLHGGMHFTYGRPDRSCDPAATVPGARSLVVAAKAYGGGPAPKRASGAVARYARSDHYGVLRHGLEALAGRLRAGGWRAEVRCDDNRLVDRAAAVRAGLGWFGRNTLVLLPGRGSWFVLGSVVTDARLAGAGRPLTPAEGCGPCRRCLSACPTGALSDGVLDARRCLAWLLEAPGVFPVEHRVALGGRVYGCDACQEACPVNRRFAPAAPADTTGATVDLLALLASSDEELLSRHRRWYVARRQARYLRRNALVALGNVGDGGDPATAAALADALAHPDPLVRAHAAWAAARLGRPDLLAAVAGDDDPQVRAELAAAGV